MSNVYSTRITIRYNYIKWLGKHPSTSTVVSQVCEEGFR